MATEIKQPAPVPDKVLPRPWQFSLRELMLWMLALSVYFGATAALGPLVGVLGGVVLAGCVLAHFHRRMPHRMSPLEWIVVGLILLALLFFLLWPAVSTPRYAIRRMSCGNTLKQIGLALHNYHDTYNCFPPAYVADSTGQPLHSWRVLILPFMEQQALYARYRFDEPWDGPNNR